MPTTLTADRWTVRAEGASVAFSGRASRFLPAVSARFTTVTGVLTDTTVDVAVDVRSLTTGNAAYDDLLAQLDPFDVARHPVARDCGQVVRCGDSAVVEGDLVLRGRTAQVRLAAGYRQQRDGSARLTATGRVDRRDFGLRLELPGTGRLVPSHLDLSIDVVAERSC